MSSGDTNPVFEISGTDRDFGTRTKHIFADLDTIEAKHSAYEKIMLQTQSPEDIMKVDPVDEPPLVSDKPQFKVPSGVPAKVKSVPQHSKTSGKWTLYDLSSVNENQMSEQSNIRSAMDFLKKCDKTEQFDATANICDARGVADNQTSAGQRHTFKKPTGSAQRTKSMTNKNSSAEKLVFKAVTEESYGASDASESKPEVGEITELSDRETLSQFARMSRHATRPSRKRNWRKESEESDDSDEDTEAKLSSEQLDKRLGVQYLSDCAVKGSDSDSDDFTEMGCLSSDDDDPTENTTITITEEEVSNSGVSDVDLDAVD